MRGPSLCRLSCPEDVGALRPTCPRSLCGLGQAQCELLDCLCGAVVARGRADSRQAAIAVTRTAKATLEKGAMNEDLTRIKQCENRIEETLWSLEIAGENDKALETYRAAETELQAFLAVPEQPVVAEAQRVLAYCLMREGNVLRVMGRPEEAGRLSEREIAAARASGDSIALARSLMSHGTNLLVGGNLDRGRQLLDEAQYLFASGRSRDHRQGLGWCWILQADLMNAGLVPGDARDVIVAAGNALSVLLPIANWPGIARAHGARAQAHERLGDPVAAERDREAQRECEAEVQVQPDRRD